MSKKKMKNAEPKANHEHPRITILNPGETAKRQEKTVILEIVKNILQMELKKLLDELLLISQEAKGELPQAVNDPEEYNDDDCYETLEVTGYVSSKDPPNKLVEAIENTKTRTNEDKKKIEISGFIAKDENPEIEVIIPGETDHQQQEKTMVEVVKSIVKNALKEIRDTISQVSNFVKGGATSGDPSYKNLMVKENTNENANQMPEIEVKISLPVATQIIPEEENGEKETAQQQEKTIPQNIGYTEEFNNDDVGSNHHYENYNVKTKRHRQQKAKSKPDERYCLSKAIQKNIKKIVGGIIVTDGCILDQLFGDSCLSSDECSDIREKPSEKDQIRMLISMILGKNKACLEKFMEEIKKQRPGIYEDIMKIYDQLKLENACEECCVICKITSRIDIKLVFDELFENETISYANYNAILYDDSPPGNQNKFWSFIFDSLDSPKTKLQYVLLSKEIGKNGQYRYLADELLKSIESGPSASMFCKCRRHIRFPCDIDGASSSSLSSPSSADNLIRGSDEAPSSPSNSTATTSSLSSDENEYEEIGKYRAAGNRQF